MRSTDRPPWQVGTATEGWQVGTACGSAPTEWPPAGDRLIRTVTFWRPQEPTLVLGSSQSLQVADRARCTLEGVRVHHRRSGGGAVLVVPGETVWVEVWVPAQDPLFDADVRRSFAWLGAAWVDALEDLGIPEKYISSHDGPLQAGSYGRLVCFAGIGPGEVMVGGRKVVGLSQRRVREGARFQCAALLRWDPERVADLLMLEREERAELLRAIEPLAAGLRQLGVGPLKVLSSRLALSELTAGELEQAFVRSLP